MLNLAVSTKSGLATTTELEEGPVGNNWPFDQAISLFARILSRKHSRYNRLIILPIP
jgi:hypothetical protein